MCARIHSRISSLTITWKSIFETFTIHRRCCSVEQTKTLITIPSLDHSLYVNTQSFSNMPEQILWTLVLFHDYQLQYPFLRRFLRYKVQRNFVKNHSKTIHFVAENCSLRKSSKLYVLTSRIAHIEYIYT